MKTLEDIAKVLQDNMSLEQMYSSPYGHGMYYFIHIREDDFSFSKNCGAGIQSFAVRYMGEIKDDSYDWETLDNEDFRATCEFLLKKVNDYISEEMNFNDDFNADFEKTEKQIKKTFKWSAI